MKIYRRKIYAEHNYDILLPDGSITHLVSGTTITKVMIIAGKGH